MVRQRFFMQGKRPERPKPLRQPDNNGTGTRRSNITEWNH